MKKLFVSCPMNGRTKEQILKSMKIGRAIAESYFNEELLVINTWIEDDPPEYIKNERLWYLAKSLELLAEADYSIIIGNYGRYIDRFKSCHIEEDIISEMDIPHYEVDLRAIAPDLYATAVPNNKKHDVYVLRKRTEED